MLDNLQGFGRTARVDDRRLNTGSSCIGCHIDGMNRANNNLRDCLDEGGARLVDHVFPLAPVRQWVLSLPPRLRYVLAWDHALCRSGSPDI
jgi:hypothetical protein